LFDNRNAILDYKETEANEVQGLGQRIYVGQTTMPQQLGYDEASNVILAGDHPLLVVIVSYLPATNSFLAMADLVTSWRDS